MNIWLRILKILLSFNVYSFIVCNIRSIYIRVYFTIFLHVNLHLSKDSVFFNLFYLHNFFFVKYKNIYFYSTFFLLFSSFLIALFHSLVERGVVEYESGCTSSVSNFESIEDLRIHLEDVPLTKCDEILFSVMGLSLANINSIISLILVFLNIYFVLKLMDQKTKKK